MQKYEAPQLIKCQNLKELTKNFSVISPIDGSQPSGPSGPR